MDFAPKWHAYSPLPPVYIEWTAKDMSLIENSIPPDGDRKFVCFWDGWDDSVKTITYTHVSHLDGKKFLVSKNSLILEYLRSEKREGPQSL